MLRAFAILLLTFSLAYGEPDRTTLRRLWASRAYTSRPFPKVWLPASVPTTERSLDTFGRFAAADGLAVSTFIARFGLPDRYLATSQQDRNSFLIYDLPSGESVALYVSKPPSDSVGAVVIIDAQGKLLRLVK